MGAFSNGTSPRCPSDGRPPAPEATPWPTGKAERLRRKALGSIKMARNWMDTSEGAYPDTRKVTTELLRAISLVQTNPHLAREILQALVTYYTPADAEFRASMATAREQLSMATAYLVEARNPNETEFGFDAEGSL